MQTMVCKHGMSAQSTGVSSLAAGVCAEGIGPDCSAVASALAAHQEPSHFSSLLIAVFSMVSADTAAEVDAFGDEQWERAARMGLPARSGAECAAQWATRLRPGTYLGDWTAEEDARLTQLAKRHKRANVRACPACPGWLLKHLCRILLWRCKLPGNARPHVF